MRVTFLGHAGLKIETDGATLLCDPWLSPEGAFQASWFQFPENSHLVTPALSDPTALVISHEHLDHVDPWFLSRVPAHVPVVIFQFPSPVLRRKSWPEANARSSRRTRGSGSRSARGRRSSSCPSLLR